MREHHGAGKPAGRLFRRRVRRGRENRGDEIHDGDVVVAHDDALVASDMAFRCPDVPGGVVAASVHGGTPGDEALERIDEHARRHPGRGSEPDQFHLRATHDRSRRDGRPEIDREIPTHHPPPPWACPPDRRRVVPGSTPRRLRRWWPPEPLPKAVEAPLCRAYAHVRGAGGVAYRHTPEQGVHQHGGVVNGHDSYRFRFGFGVRVGPRMAAPMRRASATTRGVESRWRTASGDGAGAAGQCERCGCRIGSAHDDPVEGPRCHRQVPIVDLPPGSHRSGPPPTGGVDDQQRPGAGRWETRHASLPTAAARSTRPAWSSRADVGVDRRCCDPETAGDRRGGAPGAEQLEDLSFPAGEQVIAVTGRLRSAPVGPSRQPGVSGQLRRVGTCLGRAELRGCTGRRHGLRSTTTGG